MLHHNGMAPKQTLIEIVLQIDPFLGVRPIPEVGILLRIGDMVVPLTITRAKSLADNLVTLSVIALFQIAAPNPALDCPRLIGNLDPLGVALCSRSCLEPSVGWMRFKIRKFLGVRVVPNIS